jgi:hypothetical protein
MFIEALFIIAKMQKQMGEKKITMEYKHYRKEQDLAICHSLDEPGSII